MIFVLFPLSSLEIIVPTVGRSTGGVGLCSVWYRAIFKFYTSGHLAHLQLLAPPIARLSTRRTGHQLDLAITYCTRIINIYEIRQNDGASSHVEAGADDK